MFYKKRQAFTLIELLIVVVIIGILAGIVLAVLNPAQQQKRAREGVFQANMNKMCTALYACAASTTNILNCNTETLMGAIAPTGIPAGSTYVVGGPAPLVSITGIFGTCTRTCNYNFTTSTPTPGTYTSCIVGE